MRNKRHHSLDELGGETVRTKTRKSAALGDSADAPTEAPSTESSDPIQITVSLRSSSKASGNDPKPAGYWDHFIDDMIQQTISNSHRAVQNAPAASSSHISLISSNATSVPATSENPHWSWLEQIDGDAMEKGVQIAYCDAKLIRRDQIAFGFWAGMDEPGIETSDLASELFDRYGRLERKYYEHDLNRGTGVWGPEMHSGDLLLFQSLDMECQTRRPELGARIVKAILDKVRKKSERFFALVRPLRLLRTVADVELNPMSSARSRDVIPEDQTDPKKFWQSLGFRRVGTSSWFAFVDDPDHPSRQLDISEDWNEPEEL
ncbi:hypothetical protein BGZ63DRAFT_354682 [Mariannaea sp. PMI_226]|nr:hypothetical protein BGZ63DRAFT_354682 [Mariannaea sp. PMI_226]